jgi:hypothetical protein
MALANYISQNRICRIMYDLSVPSAPKLKILETLDAIPTGSSALHLGALYDVSAPASTPAGKVLGTTATGSWGPVDPPASGLSEAQADARYLKQVGDKAEPTILFSDPTNDRVAEIEIRDDSSTTTSWPDRFGFRYYNGTASTRTGGFNEYGEGRFDAAKTTTVPLRAHGNGLAAHSANLFECRVSRAGATVFAVAANGTVTAATPTAATHLATKGYVDSRTPPILVLGPTDPVPGGTAAGTLIVRRDV